MNGNNYWVNKYVRTTLPKIAKLPSGKIYGPKEHNLKVKPQEPENTGEEELVTLSHYQPHPSWKILHNPPPITGTDATEDGLGCRNT